MTKEELKELATKANLKDPENGNESAQLKLSKIYKELSEKALTREEKKKHFIRYLKLLQMAAKFHKVKHSLDSKQAQAKLFGLAKSRALLRHYLSEKDIKNLKHKLVKIGRDNHMIIKFLENSGIGNKEKDMLNFLNANPKQYIDGRHRGKKNKKNRFSKKDALKKADALNKAIERDAYTPY